MNMLSFVARSPRLALLGHQCLLRAPVLPVPMPLVVATHVRQLAKGKKAAKAGGKGGKASKPADDDDGDNGGGSTLDLDAIQLQMSRPREHLDKEFASMQTGRASPDLLNTVRVDCGGESVPLPSLAKVLAQGPQALQVSVYDAANMGAIAKAIDQSPLGLRADQQGKLLKVSVLRPTRESTL